MLEKIKDALSPLGFEELAHGDDAVVARARDIEGVLRITGEPVPYQSFIGFCLQADNKSNKHLPVFDGHVVAWTAMGRIYQVSAVEELEELDWSNNPMDRLNLFAELAYAKRDERFIGDRPTETWLRLAYDLGSWAFEANVMLDMAPCNFMRRPSTGHIVVTDPFCL